MTLHIKRSAQKIFWVLTGLTAALLVVSAPQTAAGVADHDPATLVGLMIALWLLVNLLLYPLLNRIRLTEDALLVCEQHAWPRHSHHLHMHLEDIRCVCVGNEDFLRDELQDCPASEVEIDDYCRQDRAAMRTETSSRGMMAVVSRRGRIFLTSDRSFAQEDVEALLGALQQKGVEVRRKEPLL